MDPLEPSDPRTLGSFKIIARLGSGGMGVVFLGSRGAQRVAVKVMRSSFLDSPTLKTRFQREIETLKKLNSPHVATYLDSDIEGDLSWHAVEFVNGPTLKERVEHDGPMTTDEWNLFYGELRDALTDIHAAGVVHRDLKPSNIILSDTGLKIIDFGISHDSDATSLTTTGMVAGSPAWLSPEQLEGTEIGPGSDLFSAGSILVYAASGRSPWGNETTMTVPVAFQKILSLDFDFDGLPSAVKEAVSPLLLGKASERSFPVISRNRKFHHQDPPDEPEDPLAEKEQSTVATVLPAAAKASKAGLTVRVRVAVGFMTVVLLGVATFFAVGKGPSPISVILDNGSNLGTLSKPQSTPVFASALWEIHWIKGETYGFDPETLFAEYYTAFASEMILIREACGYGGDEGGFQENAHVRMLFDSWWLSVSEATLRNNACPNGQPLRTYTAELREVKDLVPANKCVPIRFTNTANRGAPALYEEWCVSFPKGQSANQSESPATGNESESPATGNETGFAANTSCVELDAEFNKVVQTAQQATRETRLSSWGVHKDGVIVAISDYEKFLLEVPSGRLPADFVSNSLSFSEQFRVRLYSMDESSSYAYPTAEPEYSRWIQHVKSVFEEGQYCN